MVVGHHFHPGMDVHQTSMCRRVRAGSRLVDSHDAALAVADENRMLFALRAHT